MTTCIFLTHWFFELANLHVFAFWSVFPSSEISINLSHVLKKINFHLKSPGYFKVIFHFPQDISYSVVLALGVYFILILWYFRELFFNPVKAELNSPSNNSIYPERNHISHIFKKISFPKRNIISFNRTFFINIKVSTCTVLSCRFKTDYRPFLDENMEYPGISSRMFTDSGESI